MERVSSSAPPRVSPPRPGRRSGRAAPHRIIPGLALSVAVGVFALLLSRLVPAASPALVAIVLGALAANTVLRWPGPAEMLQPGLALSSRTVLRIGIALLGLQLALGDVLALGATPLLTVVAVVGLGMGAGLLAGRLLRLPLAQSVLISCGFSICGAAAVAAAATTLESDRRLRGVRDQHRPPQEGRGGVQLETHTATAIALVVLFGTLMIPLVPLASAALGLSGTSAGTWAGASILEVAQVVAAGSLVGTEALGTAVLVKLARVLMLAPVIAILTACLLRGAPGRGHDGTAAARPPVVPGFVIAFLVAVGVRSLGILPQPVVEATGTVQSLLLAAAMFALGTGVRTQLLRQVGGRPVVLAVFLVGVVTVIGLVGALLAG